MPVVPFVEWVPDAAALGNPGSLRIVNAIPGPTSYKPIGSLAAFSDALDSRPRGAVEAADKEANMFQYAGDELKLYRLVDTAWTDASKVGGYTTSAEERWEFTRWKNKIIATNFDDVPQQIELGVTTFSDLTTDFRCRRLAVVRDFLVAANTFDASDGLMRDRIRWSAFNNETNWTPDPATGSDFRDLKTGGGIQAVVGGEFGLIVSERSTWRMSFVGTPVFFQIDEVLPGIGAIAPGSVTQLAETVYFFSERGFVAVTGASGVAFPGAGRVDQFVLNDIDESFLHRISSAADPRGGRIAWAYPGAGNVGGVPNRVVIYDRTLNKWALLEIEVELLWRAGGLGFTLEGLDAVSASVDALPASLDSSRWKGGSPLFAAFDTAFRHGFFDGPPMTATIDTKETEIHSGHQTTLNAFRALVDGGSVTARVGTRNRQSDPVVFGPPLSQTASGRFTTRASGRYHRFRLTIDDWQDAIGVQVEPHDARRSGRR